MERMSNWYLCIGKLQFFGEEGGRQSERSCECSEEGGRKSERSETSSVLYV
jgi:hypothetical protein